jgi:imidazolonepropionase-like amidohydrolase
MLPPAILEDFNALPPDAKQQVLDFIAFIKQRYPTPVKKTHLRKDSSFGAIKAKRRVTLEQMDEAIRTGGGSL